MASATKSTSKPIQAKPIQAMPIQAMPTQAMPTQASRAIPLMQSSRAYSPIIAGRKGVRTMDLANLKNSKSCGSCGH